MRTISKSLRHFHGTHKGCEIQIDREAGFRFYIIVTAPDGGHLYDGWAPDSVFNFATAKHEALCGAGLKDRKPQGPSHAPD